VEVERGHVPFLDDWKLQVELDWFLDGLVPVEIDAFEFYLLAIEGAVLVEVEQNVLVGLRPRTSLLAAQHHLAVDQRGSDLVVFAQTLAVRLLLRVLHCSKLAERVVDDPSLSPAQVLVLDVEGAAIVALLLLQAMGILVELFLSAWESFYMSW
jgi:hypothetical protein